LGIGRWPGQQQQTTSSTSICQENQYYTDHYNELIDENGEENKSCLCYVLNREDVEVREIDQVTLAILAFTFKQHVAETSSKKE